MIMEVKVNIRRTDLLKMNYYTLFHIKANYIWFAILLLSAGVGAHKSISQNGVHIWLLISSLVAVATYFVLFNVGVLINLIFASTEKGFIGPTTFNLSEEYFEESTKGTATKTKWSSINNIYKFNNYMFVRINGYRLHIVPKRDFLNEQEFDKFCSIAREKVANA